MDLSQTIKLTNKGIWNLITNAPESESYRQTCTLQYLGREDSDSITLSDGHLKQRFVLYKSIKESFAEHPLLINTIIEADLLLHKRTLFIITNFTRFRQLDKVVGDPITFDEYQVKDGFNPGATNIIDVEPATNQKAQTADTRHEKTPAPQNSKYREDDFTPIKLVSPSNNSWIICARLESKGPIRSFKRADGKEGRVSNCIFLDNSSKIQISFWDQDIDKHFPKLTEGNTYIISQASVKPANKRFNSTGNNFEITCTRETQLTLADHISSNDIKKYDLNVESISSLSNWNVGSTVSVYAFVLEEATEEELTNKEGNPLKKTVLKISDQSNTSVDVVAWGDEGKKLAALKRFEVAIFTNVGVKEFKFAKNLSINQNSRIHVDPQVDSKMRNALGVFLEEFKSSKDPETIRDLSKTQDTSATAGKSMIYSLDAVIRDAHEKIINQRTEKQYYNTYAYLDAVSLNKNITWQKNEQEKVIFLATAKISDSTNSAWITVCTGGETIFDMSPDEALALQNEERNRANEQAGEKNESLLRAKMAKRKGKGFWIKLRAQLNSYNGNNTVRFTTMAAYSSPSEVDPNCQKMNRALLNTLKQLKKSKGISG